MGDFKFTTVIRKNWKAVVNFSFKFFVFVSLTLLTLSVFFNINISTVITHAEGNQGIQNIGNVYNTSQTQYLGSVTYVTQELNTAKYAKILSLIHKGNDTFENVKFITPDGKAGLIRTVLPKTNYQVALCTSDLKECKIFEQYQQQDNVIASCTYDMGVNISPNNSCWGFGN